MNWSPLPSMFAYDPAAFGNKSPYDNVPNDMLYCHICQKHMCDGVSFERHIKDPIHLMRIPYIEERYRQTALMMRHEFKIVQHLKQMELNLARRKIKERQSYCTKCDMKFDGPAALHLKSEFHLHMNTYMLATKLNQHLERIDHTMAAKGAEESIHNVEEDTEETNESQEKDKEVITMSLTPNSDKNEEMTNDKDGLNEPQEEEENKFLNASNSNDEKVVVNEANDDEELNETQAAEEDLDVTVSALESMDSPYVANEPNDMFYCHLCKIHVWDRFENHARSLMHIDVRELLEESYRPVEKNIRLQAEIAIAMGKGRQGQSHYCDMCDVNFHGRIAAHRNTEGHIQLKKFFHPTCAECNMEFETRTDYDSHLLTAEHMIKIAEKNGRNCKVHLKITLQMIKAEEMINKVGSPTKRQREDDEDGEGDGDGDTNNGEEISQPGEEEDEITYDSDESILYIDEGNDADEENCLPAYNGPHPVSPA